MSSDLNNKGFKRRNFLKALLSVGFSTVILSGAKAKDSKNEKIRMLTADGKLVEVDKSKLSENNTKPRASNKEVFAWMKSKK